jgi:hypothetical protein
MLTESPKLAGSLTMVTVTCLQLCGMHRLDAPYRSQGSDNTVLQPYVINVGQRECLFGDHSSPIVVEIVGGDNRRVEEHGIKGVVEIIGDPIAIGGSIGPARGGGGVGTWWRCVFFSLATLFFWDGGREK